MKDYKIKVQFFLRNKDYTTRFEEFEWTPDELLIFLIHIQGYIRFDFSEFRNAYQLEMTEEIYNKTIESIENQ